jgi:hypothetical protein
VSTDTELSPAELKARDLYNADPLQPWARIAARTGLTPRRAALACADLPGAQRGRGRMPNVAKRQQARDLYAELHDWRAVGRQMGISGQAAHQLAMADDSRATAAMQGGVS